MIRKHTFFRSLQYGIAFTVLLGAPFVKASADNHSVAPSKAVGKIAPPFVRNDLNGKKIELAGYKGQVVLLNFWATWCAPCLSEMPRFVAWQKSYSAQGLQVVGVSMDDDVAPVRKMNQKLQLNYPVVMGDEKLGDSYGGVLGLPITYLIDRQGKIRYRHQGLTDLKQLESEMKLLF